MEGRSKSEEWGTIWVMSNTGDLMTVSSEYMAARLAMIYPDVIYFKAELVPQDHVQWNSTCPFCFQDMSNHQVYRVKKGDLWEPKGWACP